MPHLHLRQLDHRSAHLACGCGSPGRGCAASCHRWAAPLLFVVLLVSFAAGIWGSYRAVFPGKGLYRVTGVFESRSGDTMILVRHDAVPGLMDEMASMAFFAESKGLLDRAALKPGDRVRFTIRQVPDALLVVEIQKIQ